MTRTGRVAAWVALSGAGTCLPGCSTAHSVYGVTRTAELPGKPNEECAREVLDTTLGVERIDHNDFESGRALTITGLGQRTLYFQTFYKVHGYSVDLTLVYRDHQTTGYVHRYDNMGFPPPQSGVDAVRPIMIQVEHRLETECGMKGLGKVVEESCLGVLCR